MSVIFIIATLAVQLTCLLILLIRGIKRNIGYFITLAIITIFFIYNAWTLILMLSNDFSMVNSHRLIGSIISLITYILLFILMRISGKHKIEITKE